MIKETKFHRKRKENINYENENTKDDDIRLLVVKNSKSILDLCTGANLSIYIEQTDNLLVIIVMKSLTLLFEKQEISVMTLRIRRWILVKEICLGDSEILKSMF